MSARERAEAARQLLARIESRLTIGNYQGHDPQVEKLREHVAALTADRDAERTRVHKLDELAVADTLELASLKRQLAASEQAREQTHIKMQAEVLRLRDLYTGLRGEFLEVEQARERVEAEREALVLWMVTQYDVREEVVRGIYARAEEGSE